LADIDMFRRSRYFGPSKDISQCVRLRSLAHSPFLLPSLRYDHFMSAYGSFLPGFAELKSFDITNSTEVDGRVEVEVSVLERKEKEPRAFVFVMRRATEGRHEGCFVTDRVLPADSPYR